MLIRAMPRSARFLRRRCATVSRIVTSSVRRTDPEVPSPDRAVLQSQHGMQMKARLAIITFRNITD